MQRQPPPRSTAPIEACPRSSRDASNAHAAATHHRNDCRAAFALAATSPSLQEIEMNKPGITDRMTAVFCKIEDEIEAGNAAPSTTELAKHCGYSTGEIARILDALERMGYISRIVGRRRNIKLTSPGVTMAADEHLIAELNKRGYMVRKPLPN
jgi:DNA-binding transcriptional regulator YhcF (GntR family)